WDINTFCNGVWTGYDWAQTFTTLEDTIVCEPVNQLAENITAHSADLSWEGLDGPTWVRYFETGSAHYKYRYADTTNMLSLEFLKCATEFTWELNTYCNGMWTGYNWPQVFTTLEDTAVVNCEPENLTAGNVSSNSADLSWESIQGATYVRYFPVGTQTYKYAFTIETGVSIFNLLPETDYEWQINNYCQGSWTGYNTGGAFTTLPDTASDFNTAGNEPKTFKVAGMETNEIANFYAFPNPTKMQTQITFTTETVGAFNVRVMNLMGSIIQEQSLIANAGLNTLSIDLGNQGNGIYFVILTWKNNMAKIKLIKR
ncbi:MAG: T9SS type A sorting domain-containing protein, partial [Bacteroidales bacterium]|nr:T9SS type A sorting domain-containing protein [Bacteroidales bacterium]